jgi:predicted RNA-binding protein YlxR (DUF448 family)
LVRRRSRAGSDGVIATETVSHTVPTPIAAAPQRRCIVSGETHDRSTLLRFVVGPDGAVVPDVEARLPGRGLWLLPRRDIVDRAVTKRVFARAARSPVLASPELADLVETLLARRCRDSLGLARRAGLAVAGFERVSEAVRRSDATLLLFALDSAEAGRRKLAALAPRATLATVLDSGELSEVFGREQAMFVAVGSGPLHARLVLDIERLAGFRVTATIDYRMDGGTQAHE